MRQGPAPPRPARSSAIALALLALLAAVVIVNLLVSLPQFLFYGIAGGLVFCLLIIGRDALLATQHTLDTPSPPASPDRNDH